MPPTVTGRDWLTAILMLALLCLAGAAHAEKPPIKGCRMWGEPRLTPSKMLTKCEADIAETPLRSAARGELTMQRGNIHAWFRSDYTAAIADYNAAAALLPNDHRPALYRASALDELGQYAEAIKSFDLALRLGPDKFEQGEILRGRCWSRAASNLPAELAKAETDCGEAARLFFGPDPFTFRGMIYIKQRRWTEALRDFDFAMRMKNTGNYALMLYGRGLTQVLSNDHPAEGRADIAAALAKSPKLGERLAARGWVRP